MHLQQARQKVNPQEVERNAGPDYWYDDESAVIRRMQAFAERELLAAFGFLEVATVPNEGSRESRRTAFGEWEKRLGSDDDWHFVPDEEGGSPGA